MCIDIIFKNAQKSGNDASLWQLRCERISGKREEEVYSYFDPFFVVFGCMHFHLRCFPGGSVVKNLCANAGDVGSIPDLGRSPGEGNGNLLQYSCLGNLMERGSWWAIVHGVQKSWTQLSS